MIPALGEIWSIVRSVLLCAFVGIGLASRRSIDKIQLLSLSVLAMLIYHPLDLWDNRRRAVTKSALHETTIRRDIAIYRTRQRLKIVC